MILVVFEDGRHAGFGGGDLIQKDAERWQELVAAPFEFTDAFSAVRAIREFFGLKSLVPAMPVGLGDNLEFTSRKIRVDPVRGANGGKTATVQGFWNDVSD